MPAFHPMARSRHLRIVAVAALTMAIALAGSVAPASAGGGVSVSVSCYSSPEKVTIRNNRSSSVRIISVGSTYQPYSDEPFYVNKTLGAGSRITYSFGSGSGPHKLTGRFIFNNDASTESARVKFGFGKIRRYC